MNWGVSRRRITRYIKRPAVADQAVSTSQGVLVQPTKEKEKNEKTEIGNKGESTLAIVKCRKRQPPEAVTFGCSGELKSDNKGSRQKSESRNINGLEVQRPNNIT